MSAPDLRVLHLASGDLWAGAEVQIYQLLAELQRSDNVQPSAVLLNEGELAQRLRLCAVPVTILPETTLSPIGLVRQLIHVLREQSPDLVHTHGRKANILGSVSTMVGMRNPTIRTVHGHAETSSDTRLQARFLRAVDTLVGRYAQRRIISVSHELEPELSARFGKRKLTVIENGLDVEAVRRSAKLPVEFPADGRLRIGFVGRLVPVKRVDLFLRMARVLVNKNPERYRFHVFGDGPLLEEAKRLRANLELADIVYMEGFKPALAPYMSRLDILVMPSDHEGLPMTLLEAVALEIPIVANSVGGIPRVFDTTGAAGRLVTTQSPADYAVAVEHLLNDAGRCVRSRAALERLRDDYGSARQASEYNRLYRSTLAHASQKKIPA